MSKRRGKAVPFRVPDSYWLLGLYGEARRDPTPDEVRGYVRWLRRELACAEAYLTEPAAEAEPRPAVDEKVAAERLVELRLGMRVINCLESEGVETVGHLLTYSDDELLQLRNFGEHSLKEVREALAERGLSLKGDPPAEPKEAKS